MIANEDAARDWLLSSGLDNAGSMERLERLARLLVTENEKQNLISKGSVHEMWRRHIADSAQLLTYVSRETSTWLDLGTGAGFPGLVIAILRPDCRVSMVESRARRVAWLAEVCAALELDNAEILGTRLEVVETRKVDAISARAFAPLPRLLTLSARFSTTETVWLLPKGRSARQELDDLRGWRHTFHVKQSLTEPQAGVIVGTLTAGKGKRS